MLRFSEYLLVFVLAVLGFLLELAARQKGRICLCPIYNMNDTLKPAEAHLNGVEVRGYGTYALMLLHLNIAAIDYILNLCRVTIKRLQKA